MSYRTLRVRHLAAKRREEAERMEEAANWKKAIGYESAQLKREKRLAMRLNDPGGWGFACCVAAKTPCPHTMLPTHGMVRLSHHTGTHMVEAGGRCLIRKYGTTVVRAQAIKRGWSDSDVVTREFEVCSTCQRAQLFAS